MQTMLTFTGRPLNFLAYADKILAGDLVMGIKNKNIEPILGGKIGF